MIEIDRVYQANDLDKTDTNPVTVSVITTSTNLDTIQLSFQRNSTDTCSLCEYRFDKADIETLYLYLKDALTWIDYQDSTGGGTTNPSPSPVPPDNSGCDKNSTSCVQCVDSNLPTSPLGPYDPDFWPTLR